MVEAIDTRFGTKNSYMLSNGNCLPLTSLPFGMNAFAPQTGTGAWWFDPDAENYSGFRLTHQATVWSGANGDYCSLRLLPFSPQNRGITDVPFTPDQSVFQPDKLIIRQNDADLITTLVPTQYGAIMRVNSHFKELGFIIGFPSTGILNRIDKNTIDGEVYQQQINFGEKLTLYFRIDFNWSIEKKSKLANGEWMLDFIPGSEPLNIRIGTSYISAAKSKKNQPKGCLEYFQKEATCCWQKKLSKIMVNGENYLQKEIFQHMMYRVFLFPQRQYEIDDSGNPIHWDQYSNKVRSGFLYTGSGMWDMSRTSYPLLTLIDTREYQQILAGFLNSYKESGYLPKWLYPDENGGMSGNLIESVIADAAVKGLINDSLPILLSALIDGTTKQDISGIRGRRYSNVYNQLGYIPSGIRESVSNTLEYSYGDYCISRVASVLEKKQLMKHYREGGLNYKKLFDKQRGFMVAKDRSGHFRENFNPTSWLRDYTEGSAWQWTFAVPHDIQGLIRLFGSSVNFEHSIIKMANMQAKYDAGPRDHITHEMNEMRKNEFGQINLGDQPSFHLPYLYHFISKPYFSQPILKQLMTRLFTASFKAYPGDEDNGSMSAWYIFNALGFYPFCPGSGQYLFGIPLFDRAVMHLSNGNELIITAEHNFPQYQFVDKLLLDHQKFKASFITHARLLKTKQIDFTLGITPNPYCFSKNKRPFSLTK